MGKNGRAFYDDVQALVLDMLCVEDWVTEKELSICFKLPRRQIGRILRPLVDDGVLCTVTTLVDSENLLDTGEGEDGTTGTGGAGSGAGAAQEAAGGDGSAEKGSKRVSQDCFYINDRFFVDVVALRKARIDAEITRRSQSDAFADDKVYGCSACGSRWTVPQVAEYNARAGNRGEFVCPNRTCRSVLPPPRTAAASVAAGDASLKKFMNQLSGTSTVSGAPGGSLKALLEAVQGQALALTTPRERLADEEAEKLRQDEAELQRRKADKLAGRARGALSGPRGSAGGLDMSWDSPDGAHPSKRARIQQPTVKAAPVYDLAEAERFVASGGVDGAAAARAAEARKHAQAADSDDDDDDWEEV